MISRVLIAALIMAESHGNDRARGTHGEVGCLQIKGGVIEDVNKAYRTHYTPGDRLSRQKSIEICRLYLEIYYTGDRTTDWGYAMTWHFGPSGRHTATLDDCLCYWEKVNYFLHHEQHASHSRGPWARLLDRAVRLCRIRPHADADS